MTPDEARALLASDLKGRRPVKESNPLLMWTVLVLLLAGLIYLVVRFTGSPSKLTLVNASGAEVSSVIVASGDQRMDLGAIANGEVRKIDLVPGKPLRIEYTFEQRRVWTNSEPLTAFQFLTVFIGTDKKLRVETHRPTAR
ncbi:MAG TPA: hypothetical protein VER58_01785 [Thermoanaerobaculia bacterium]|nr:hypothetical protein [Thermoanaerobaculia bacterium]